MAKEFEDGELWLPAELLTDDFFRDGGPKPAEALGSSLDSPVESVTTSAESDEEVDYMAALTQRMALFFLQDDDLDSAAAAAAAASGHSKANERSPQSTLCQWSASNRGSPSGPSLVSSPSSLSPLQQHQQQQQRRRKEQSCDLLYEAVGQVMRMRLLTDLGRGQAVREERGIVGPPERPSPAVASAAPKTGCCASGHIVTDHRLEAAHFYHMKRQQAMKQQHTSAWGRQSKAPGSPGGPAGGGQVEGRCGRPLDLPPSAWPPLIKPSPRAQQPPLQPGSGTPELFPKNSGPRKESAGTGVFLPRTAGGKQEPRRKTGCSSVLVPDRVVHALNLSMEEFSALPRFPGGFVLNRDALIGRSSAVQSHQKRSRISDHPTTAATAENGFLLPREWTY